MTIQKLSINDTIRQAMLDIAAAHQGYLSPEAVVEAAKSEGHVLHDYFQWDNDAAATQFRIAQAAFLIRRVKLHLVKIDQETKTIDIQPVRAFESEPQRRKTADASYRSVPVLMADTDARADLLAACRRELADIRHRYERLSELADVWAAVDAVLKDVTRE